MPDFQRSALEIPEHDPAPIFEAIRANYATELLAAAVEHFKVFEHLKGGPHSFSALRRKMGLAERPAAVLLTALQAMGLIGRDDQTRMHLTPLAREHLTGGPFDVSDYIAFNGQSAGVVELVKRLKTNMPANADQEQGAAFIYREGIESAMEREDQARMLTLALAGRSRNIAPLLAQKMPLHGSRLLLDVGGGTGIYTFALLQGNPQLRAIVWDRPEVLKVTAELAAYYDVADRVECRAGNMFVDSVPAGCDVILLSNVLHDWDEPQCRTLIKRLADALTSGGLMLIHDALLNDNQDGPLSVALYSAALFSLTEGRAYSGAEFTKWMVEVGLTVGSAIPTLAHCSVIAGTK
ncbi:MAG TPA: methyltransferase [Planctomycetota bacterium]|nr:methyltransferase [Planctomycetota bacterium]